MLPCWPDNRRTFRFRFLVADSTGGVDRPLSGLEFLPSPSVSIGVPAADDPHSRHRLQPSHLPAATTGIECRLHGLALDGRSSHARGQRNHAYSYPFGSSRRRQRHPVLDFTSDTRHDLRLSDGT